MNGNSPIVIRIDNHGGVDNGHRYFEHPSVDAAKAEAHRLAAKHPGQFVVYVPIALISPAPRTVETRVVMPRSAA